MALTVNSPKATMVVVSANASYKANLSGASKGGVLYVFYTKDAGEGGVRLSLSTLAPEVDAANRFQMVASSAAYVLSGLYYDLTATGRYRIPLSLILGEKDLLVSVAVTSGTPGGTVSLEFREGE